MKCADNAEILDAINNARREIDMFLKSPELNSFRLFYYEKEMNYFSPIPDSNTS